MRVRSGTAALCGHFEPRHPSARLLPAQIQAQLSANYSSFDGCEQKHAVLVRGSPSVPGSMVSCCLRQILALPSKHRSRMTH